MNPEKVVVYNINIEYEYQRELGTSEKKLYWKEIEVDVELGGNAISLLYMDHEGKEKEKSLVRRPQMRENIIDSEILELALEEAEEELENLGFTVEGEES